MKETRQINGYKIESIFDGAYTFVKIPVKDLERSVYVLPTNRNLSVGNMKSIGESIKKTGIPPIKPILFFNEQLNKFGIIDGNHRVNILKEIGEESIVFEFLPQIKNENEATNYMIEINNKSKKWPLIDYVSCVAKSGNQIYKIFLKEFEERGLPITTVAQAYSQENRAVATAMLKGGNFKIKDKKYGDVLLDNISECMKHSQSTRQMGEALVKFMMSEKKYNQAKMVRKLKSLRNNFQYSTKEGELLKQLSIIYKG